MNTRHGPNLPAAWAGTHGLGGTASSSDTTQRGRLIGPRTRIRSETRRRGFQPVPPHLREELAEGRAGRALVHTRPHPLFLQNFRQGAVPMLRQAYALSSRAEGAGEPLQLHYLGIPLASV